MSVREEIAKRFLHYSDMSDYSWEELSSSTQGMFLARADQIIPKIIEEIEKMPVLSIEEILKAKYLDVRNTPQYEQFRGMERLDAQDKAVAQAQKQDILSKLKEESHEKLT